MKRIQTWVKTLYLKKWGRESSFELSLTFVTDNKIKTLNKQYRGKNKPTDVLAFPLESGIGDIVISVETAKRNAKKFGKTFIDELKFLMIHGFLHLLGYDHEISRKEEIRMQKKEKEYMRLLEGR